MKILILLLLSSFFCFGDVLYFNNGKNLKGDIIEANATHALIKRSSDLQLFRIAIDSLTKDNQAYINDTLTVQNNTLDPNVGITYSNLFADNLLFGQQGTAPNGGAIVDTTQNPVAIFQVADGNGNNWKPSKQALEVFFAQENSKINFNTLESKQNQVTILFRNLSA